MNRRICRQVLDCGDGVCEVTALVSGITRDSEPRRRHSYPEPKAATPETPSPQSKTLARRLAPHSVRGPNARLKGQGVFR